MSLSKKLTELTPSATLGLTARVRELKAEGKDVIGLTLGEPDFDTPAHIIEAAKEALDAGYTHYPPLAGYPALREAIAHKLHRDNGLNWPAANIVVSTGAKQSIYNVVMTLANPGDEAIIPAPYWVSYQGISELAQVEMKTLQTTVQSGFRITPQQLEAAISPRTKFFLFSTPSNPTGSMYSEADLRALAAVFARHPHVYIIADEIYEEIIFEGKHFSIGAIPEIADRVITINGFSKGFAMTGWRLGYMAGPADVVKLCNKLQGQCTSGANAAAQQAAIAALTGDRQPIINMRETFRQRRDWLHGELSQIEGLGLTLPEGAFYFYPDISHYFGYKTPGGKEIRAANDLCMHLLDHAGLAVVSGEGFGTDSHFRISYAYSQETLADAVSRLKKGLAALKRGS